MACDLWGPSFPEEESSSSLQPRWQYDFYRDYGFDTIEEYALKEKSCIQVLRILIMKADTEIDELEKDLVFLQSELAWAEHEDRFDVCCNALRAKIDCLDMSIMKLRKKDENDIKVYLLMHTEPAEKLHEMVKSLLKSFWHEKDEQNKQPQDIVTLGSSCSCPEQLADLNKNQKLSSSDSHVIQKEEIEVPSVTAIENCTSSNSSKELEEKNENGSETLAITNFKDLISHSMAPATDQSNEKKVVTILDLETTKKQGIEECVRTLKSKNMIQHSLPKSVQKRMHNVDKTKVKEAVARSVNGSALDALRHAVGHLNKKKKLNASSLKNASEGATLHAAADGKLKRADLSKKVKDEPPADIIAMDLGSVAYKLSAGNINEMKELCKPELKVNGCHEAQEYCATIGKSKTSNSCLTTEHKGTILKEDKLTNAMVKTTSPDTLQHWTGLNGKGNNSNSGSAAFGLAEGLNCDMEEKLCEFAMKSARKRGIKELKVASTNKNGASNSLLIVELKTEDSMQVVRQKEAALNYNEQSALTSLIDLNDERGQDKTILQLEQKPLVEEILVAENTGCDDKHVMDLNMRPQKGKMKTVKTDMESNSVSIEALCLNSKESGSNLSLTSKGKRPWKYGNSHMVNYSLSGKIIKKPVQHSQCEAEEQSMKLDSRQNTMSLPQKKCKMLSNIPVIVEISDSSVQMNISKLHGDLNGNRAKTDISISEASFDDSCTNSLAPFPLDVSNLMKMKLCDLKAIAKAQKLPKYSGLRKEELVKELGNRLSC